MIEKEDITFLKKYIKENKTTDGIFIDLNTLDKILDIIDIISVQELPSNDKKYDISFLKEYLNLKGITTEKFSKYLGISKVHIYRVLDGSMTINSVHLNRLLDLFNVKSYEELQILVKNDIEKYNNEYKNNKFEINELRKFLKENKISNLSYANYLGIKKAHIYRLFNGELEMKPKYINKTIILMNSEELIQELANKKTKPNKYDISFLKEYLQLHNIDQIELADYLEISLPYMKDLLYGKKLASEKHLNKLLISFQADSYEDLKELVNNNVKILKRTSK